MIIHLTGSTINIEEDISYLRRISKAIVENDGTLARDWIEAAYHRAMADDYNPEENDWEAIVDESIDAIGKSDVVIVEASSYTFSQGMQAAIALQQKKPVLIVSRSSLKGRFVAGYKSRDLRVVEYQSEKELDNIVSQFIRDNTISTKDLRFNMFIDRPIYNYLRSVSYESGKNKSEIIRELINREIRKKN